jgi:molecular chaperone DnaK
MLLGIDLGTTYCAMAALDESGRPRMLPNRDGEILTPSAIYLAPDGTAVVGQAAQDISLEQPQRVATLVKRRMGYPDYGRAVAGREFRPETLSAIILKKLAQDAQLSGEAIDGCVITVPAYFDDTRRRATWNAATIAGLPVLDIIDEPTAAALAYAYQQGWTHPGPAPEPASPASGHEASRIVLVYDLGGGTFDVTLVKLARQRFQVLAIEGDVRLGGRDWDERLAQWAAEQFRDKYGTDPRQDAHSQAQLLAAAERVKRTLSKVEQTTLTVVHEGQRLVLSVSRQLLEELTRDLLLRTRLTMQQLLRQARLSWEQIDQLLLVGGSTHMPAVARLLKELSGRDPERSLAVSEVVARGAAIHAGICRASQTRRVWPPAAGPEAAPSSPQGTVWADVVEIHVNAHSLGVEVRSGSEKINHKLIPKNTQLPAAAEHVYYTVRDNQTRVRIRILQGEAHQAEACIPVGECWIEDLPPGLPRGSPVQVRCGVATNGCIEVAAIDLTSGRAVSATLHRPGGLTDEQILREAEWLHALRVL